MISFYFKDRLINDFFYKDVFCVPIEISQKLEKKVEINFIGSDKIVNNPYLGNIKIKIHKNYFFMIIYFLKNIKKIEILGLFHIYSHSILFTYFYKIFNFKGKVYIKGDFNKDAINNLIKLNIKNKKFLSYLLDKIDYLSFENKELYELFFKNIIFKNKSYIIKNSLFLNGNDKIDFSNKENIILCVGRIFYEDAKRYSFFLKSLLLNKKLKNWKIIFIGSLKGSFNGKSYDFLKSNKDLIDEIINKGIKIDFLGPIYDRELLADYFLKSKIFCLSSISEGDPLVQYESMFYGNIMVSTNVGTIKENYYKNGLFLSKLNSTNDYNKRLEESIELIENIDNNKIFFDIHNFCKEKYTWEKNLSKLINDLKGN